MALRLIHQEVFYIALGMPCVSTLVKEMIKQCHRPPLQMLEEDAMFKVALPEQLTPTWKMLLLSDGSVTRHLQLLAAQHIEVVSWLKMLTFYLGAAGLVETS